MKYDFSSLIDRHGMDSIAVDSWGEIPGMAPNAPDEGFDRIPMWVADMNFATVPTVQEHIIQRAQHPMFGYFNPRPEYFDRIIEWQSRRNGVEGLRPEHIGYENGVLGGVVSTLRAYVQPGDAVLVHSPTYIGFTKSIEAAGYRIVHSPLKLDDQGVWRMDFEDMERKLAQNHIHAAVFCSPHNPCGRVWERDEIERAMDIYRQHDCVVISDEIWSDIILPGHKHIPTQSVSEDARMRTVALYAPSKTFNLAGLVGSYHIIYNETLRDRVCAVSNKTHYNEMNVLIPHAHACPLIEQPLNIAAMLSAPLGAVQKHHVRALRTRIGHALKMLVHVIAEVLDIVGKHLVELVHPLVALRLVGTDKRVHGEDVQPGGPGRQLPHHL